MLRNIKELFGYSILTQDGDIGHIEDFYFDDDHWTIRYAVVNCGSWLSGREVLISPEAFKGTPSGTSRHLPVKLTKNQVRNSPDIDTHKPVSRQQEMGLFTYYNWPTYWPPMPSMAGALADIPAATKANETDSKIEPHLRSIKEVKKYSIDSIDGTIGHVDDFIIDDTTWKVRYMVVNTKKWLGRHVLIAVSWIEKISWPDAQVSVKLTREQVKNSPPNNALLPIDREYEKKLHEYYQKQEYWV